MWINPPIIHYKNVKYGFEYHFFRGYYSNIFQILIHEQKFEID